MGITVKITGKQRLFIEEYLKDFNGTQAAVRAGYSKKTARQTAYENLTKPYIRQEISRELERIYDGHKNDQEKIIRELAIVAFSRITDYAEITDDDIILRSETEIPRELMGAIAEIRISETKEGKRKNIKLHNKIEALKLLGNYHRLFDENYKKPFDITLKVTTIHDFDK
ncbi:MAG TPA: terminase small subunit [Melioribacteraceae bacterium]|nr:terminase small subunit [Melioribacteraceae bacterium]